MPTLTLRAHYYRQHDADVTADIPGRAFSGWTTRLLEVPLERTALVSMHVWNPGLDPRIPSGPDSPYHGWFRVVEYLPRAMKITRELFPPLLAAAREAGLTVIHVGSQESYTAHYPGYQHSKELAEREARESGTASVTPLRAVEDPLRDQWARERHRQFTGEHNIEPIRAGFQHIDFAPQAMPIDGESVVINSPQLNAVCRERGIWHLIYIGFALNWCLLASPGGMLDMSRLGYQCSTIRQATTAVENGASCTDEWAKELALWRVALMFGYVFDLNPVLEALAQVRPGHSE